MDPRRAVDAQSVGGRKPCELPAPERLCPRRILFLQPDDVVAERPDRRQRRLPTLPERRVDEAQIPDQEGQRPAVQQQMMESPDEAGLPAEMDQREAQQRCPAQRKRRVPVAMTEICEAALLLVLGEAAPIQL